MTRAGPLVPSGSPADAGRPGVSRAADARPGRARRLPAMPDTALGPGHGHVIVCGTEHLGLRTIDELRRRDEDVVAIAPDGDAADPLAALDVRLVVGDARQARTLTEAGIGEASAIVMTGDDDLANLNIALAATEVEPGDPGRHPDVRHGARRPHPRAVRRRRRAVVVGAGGARLRLGRDRRRDRRSVRARRAGPDGADRRRPCPRRRAPCRSPGCSPIAASSCCPRPRPPTTPASSSSTSRTPGEPDDAAPVPDRRRLHERRRSAVRSAGSASGCARPSSACSGSGRVLVLARRRVRPVLRADRRPHAARRGVLRDHPADRRGPADGRSMRPRRPRRCASTRSS